MPPNKKISAPTGRVYKSAIPFKQTTFQGQKKRISYGKATSKRVPKPDNTLTQMDYVFMNRPLDEKDKQSGVDEGDADPYTAEPAKVGRIRRKAAIVVVDQNDDIGGPEKRRSKRRKTAGDSLDESEPKLTKVNKRRRKTLGDPPSSSNFHTQTLTQIESWSSRSMSPSIPGEQNEEEGEENKNQGSSIFDAPTSSQLLVQHRRARKSTKPLSPSRELPPHPSSETMPPPQTPRRRLGSEIPSSQSPATPLSLPSRNSQRRRTPLREQSSNTPIPFSVPKRDPPKLVIRDTFSTDSQLSRNPGSPGKRSSPPKSVRFADVDEVVSEDEHSYSGEENYVEDQVVEKEEEEEQRASGDEENVEDETVIASPVVKSEPDPTQPSEVDRPLTRRSIRDEILDSDAESDLEDEDIKSESGDDAGALSEEISEAGDQDPETCYGDIGLETQFEAEQLIISQEMDSNPEGSQILGKGRNLESQRISETQADRMLPRTMQSDIFISIHPPHVKNIRKRTKDHEFRTWAIPPTVVRVWIYETAPTSQIKYMAPISSAKRPGEILDERGLGNAEFNVKPVDASEYAYEILGLYELATPLSLADLKEKEWLKAAPQKMAWVKPAVLDELMGNLKPALFIKTEPPPISQEPSTDTQEADAQLFSTIKQFTEAEPEYIEATPIFTEEIPSDPSLPAPTQHSTPHRMRPSQTETVDLSPSGTPRHSLPEIILESPSRPVPTSTPQLPPTPFPRLSQSDPVVPFSMVSSQLMTKSQMLPDSLLNESVPHPPLFVDDSDEELD